MTIIELETKNGRVYRVAINNANQKTRLNRVIEANKKKGYEVFIRVETVQDGIHDIATFEKIANDLV